MGLERPHRTARCNKRGARRVGGREARQTKDTAMPINSPSDLEKAVQEFQRLRDAPADSPDAARRDEIDAEIKAYYAQHAGDLETGRGSRY